MGKSLVSCFLTHSVYMYYTYCDYPVQVEANIWHILCGTRHPKNLIWKSYKIHSDKTKCQPAIPKIY